MGWLKYSTIIIVFLMTFLHTYAQKPFLERCKVVYKTGETQLRWIFTDAKQIETLILMGLEYNPHSNEEHWTLIEVYNHKGRQTQFQEVIIPNKFYTDYQLRITTVNGEKYKYNSKAELPEIHCWASR